MDKVEIGGITLGNEYSDAVTGFKGRATAYSMFINGCVRVLLEAGDEKGQPVEYWFDEQRLLVGQGPKAGQAVEPVATAGGPRRDAPRAGK